MKKKAIKILVGIWLFCFTILVSPIMVILMVIGEVNSKLGYKILSHMDNLIQFQER